MEAAQNVRIAPFPAGTSIAVYEAQGFDHGTNTGTLAAIADVDGNPLPNPYPAPEDGELFHRADTGVYHLRIGGLPADAAYNGGAGIWLKYQTHIDPADKADAAATAAAISARARLSGFPADAEGNYFVSLNYNETTRTLTITPTGATFSVFVDGTEYVFTGARSIQHPATQGGHFIYVDNTGSLVTSQSVWYLPQTAPVSYVMWCMTNSVAIPFFELHHAGRDVWLHQRLHLLDGTMSYEGFGVSGYVLDDGASDAALTFAVASGTVVDEDISVVTEALPVGGPYMLAERAGADGTWILTPNQALPCLYSGNLLQYNQFTGATWQRTAVPEDNYCNVFVFALPALPTTAITPTPAATRQIVIVPGQQVFATPEAAHAETVANITWDELPFQEMAPIAQVTLRRNANAPQAYTNSIRAAIVRLVKVVGSRASITQSAQQDHGSSTGLTDDDHPQYALADGSRGAFEAQGAVAAHLAGTQHGTTSQEQADITANNAHRDVTGNPHGTTKADIGLGNVDNTADADKPVSTAQQAALNAKADLVGGLVPLSQLPPESRQPALGVLDIAARDLLDGAQYPHVFVADASADATVDSGWAIYRWVNPSWVKLSEQEGLDIVVDWSNITGKPSSFLTVQEAADLAAALAHSQSAHAPSNAEANPTAVTQGEAEAGTEVALRSWSVVRVWQAIKSAVLNALFRSPKWEFQTIANPTGSIDIDATGAATGKAARVHIDANGAFTINDILDSLSAGEEIQVVVSITHTGGPHAIGINTANIEAPSEWAATAAGETEVVSWARIAGSAYWSIVDQPYLVQVAAP